MKKLYPLFVISLVLITIQPLYSQAPISSEIATKKIGTDKQSINWSTSKLSRLRSWMLDAPNDALPNVPVKKLNQAIASKNQELINQIANMEALKLGHMHLMGCCSKAERSGWAIKSDDDKLNLASLLRVSLETNDIDGYFIDLLPRHAEYWALRNAYQNERDKNLRIIIARNMERWRWMPLNLGSNHLIVNIPHYKLTYWQDGNRRQTWPVIVGKKSSPTPVFNSIVTGVTFNPWWEIPQSIVKESVGALVRRNPTEARRRGYVVQNGRYRQKPGANNALGLMKLAMPNPYSVYIHDTPNKALFEREVRTFSHGCIRTGDAIGFASVLVEGSISRADVDKIIDSGKTTTVPLTIKTPVYIAYFTASIGDDGNITYHPDIYNRDVRLGDTSNPERFCAA